jgi:hypothetical protein
MYATWNSSATADIFSDRLSQQAVRRSIANRVFDGPPF